MLSSAVCTDRQPSHVPFLAAGISCAFAAPIGGLLLAIEEGSSFYSTSMFWRGFLATCTAVLTVHFLAQLHEEPWGIMESKFGIRRDLGLYDGECAVLLVSEFDACRGLQLYNTLCAGAAANWMCDACRAMWL